MKENQTALIERYERRTHTMSWADYLRDYREVERIESFCKPCRNYAKLWTCPPFTAERALADYPQTDDALITLHADLVYPHPAVRQAVSEGKSTIDEVARLIFAEARKKIDSDLLAMEATKPMSRAFFAGCCHLCPDGTCTRLQGLPCKYPDRMRLSLEAIGFDLMRTANDLLDTQVLWSKQGALCAYFTLLSGLVWRPTEEHK